MTRKLLSQSEFHAEARAGRTADTPVALSATVQRTATDGSRTIRWTLSDGSVDRMGDTIDPNGWNLVSYKSNPVVLWSHDASAPPIGRMHGPWVENGSLVGDVEFADRETYGFADDIFRLVQGGFIKAGSVGFLPIKYRFSDDKERPYGVDFMQQELLEFSITPVPANANALIQAQAKGLSTAPLRGRSPTASARTAAALRDWAHQVATADPEEEMRMVRARNLHRGLTEPRRSALSVDATEAEMVVNARRLALGHLRDGADLSTAAGRAQHARRLRAFHSDRVVDPRAAAAEAAYRTAPRW